MELIRIQIDAVPVAQPRQRHRVVTSGGKSFATNYTPSKDPVNVFKAACQMTVAELGIDLITEPVIVDLVFVMPRPKRLDGKTKPQGRIPHGSKPDKDNLCKSVFDGLNGFLWRDDSLIYDGRVAKFYAARNETPHVELVIWR